MSRKNLNTEKNIQMLISSSLKTADRLDDHQKELVLDLLLHKMEQQKEKALPVSAGIIGHSVLWLVAVVLVFSKFQTSLCIIELIKVALGISLFIIPVSSIVIILKSRTDEKRMV